MLGYEVGEGLGDRQLVSSELADELIARMGAVWAHEVAAETGRQPWEAAAAYWAAREVLGAGPLLEEVDTVAWTVSPEAESALRDCLSSALGRLARWYLARQGVVDPMGDDSVGAGLAVAVAADRPYVSQLDEVCSRQGAPVAGPMDTRPLVAELVALGAPEDLSSRIAQLVRNAAVGELAEVARATGRDLGDVTAAYAVVEEGLALRGLANVLGNAKTSTAGNGGSSTCWVTTWLTAEWPP